jgi:hypothetical protein
MWGALPDEETGLWFTTAAGPRQRSHSRFRVLRAHGHIFSLRFETPQPGGPGPRIYTPMNNVTQLYPQALGSPFVAAYVASERTA